MQRSHSVVCTEMGTGNGLLTGGVRDAVRWIACVRYRSGGPRQWPGQIASHCAATQSAWRGGDWEGGSSHLGCSKQLSQEGRKRRRCWDMHTLAWHLRQLRQRLQQKRHKTLTSHCPGTCRHLSLNSEKRTNASQLLHCSFGRQGFATDTGSTGKQPCIRTKSSPAR